MNSSNKYSCCFFGHRDTPKEILPLLTKEIENLIVNENVFMFYLGGYGNFDAYAASTLKKLKTNYPFIRLIYVSAYLSALENNKALLSSFDETIYPHGLETVPKKFAISHRNRWIVENCDYMIAYVCRSYGGAYAAFNYGKNKTIRIINLSDNH